MLIKIKRETVEELKRLKFHLGRGLLKRENRRIYRLRVIIGTRQLPEVGGEEIGVKLPLNAGGSLFKGAVKLLLFSVKFINYNDFSNFDAGETLHDW
jgi:hypothetical protein